MRSLIMHYDITKEKGSASKQWWSRPELSDMQATIETTRELAGWLSHRGSANRMCA